MKIRQLPTLPGHQQHGIDFVGKKWPLSSTWKDFNCLRHSRKMLIYFCLHQKFSRWCEKDLMDSFSIKKQYCQCRVGIIIIMMKFSHNRLVSGSFYIEMGPSPPWCVQGLIQYSRCHLTTRGNPIVEIRWSFDRLISTMGVPLLVRWYDYIESGPSVCPSVPIGPAVSPLVSASQWLQGCLKDNSLT